jgi:hypothetical protein
MLEASQLDLFEQAKSGPLSPKEFEFKVIRAIDACALNAKWHSRLPAIHWSNVVRNTHYVCFAALFEGQIYAITIWSSPVAQNRFAQGKQVLELRRMAISEHCPRNTATRMLAHNRSWIKNNFQDIALLVSYQDTEVHHGTIYKADNWQLANYTKGIKWDTEKRQRNLEQSLADKIRWEYKLKDYLPDDKAKEIRQNYAPRDFIGGL